MSKNRRVLIIRHTPVCSNLKGICYGASDVDLAKEAEAHINNVCDELQMVVPPDDNADIRLVHSGLQRAHRLANRIGERFGIPIDAQDDRLAEMNFGAWELKSWQSIFLAEGHRMADMIHKPDSYAPPGGETAHAVRDRVLAWFSEEIHIESKFPSNGSAITVAVSHGGPIAALKGTFAKKPAKDWPNLVPAYGEITDLSIQAVP